MFDEKSALKDMLQEILEMARGASADRLKSKFAPAPKDPEESAPIPGVDAGEGEGDEGGGDGPSPEELEELLAMLGKGGGSGGAGGVGMGGMGGAGC